MGTKLHKLVPVYQFNQRLVRPPAMGTAALEHCIDDHVTGYRCLSHCVPHLFSPLAGCSLHSPVIPSRIRGATRAGTRKLGVPRAPLAARCLIPCRVPDRLGPQFYFLESAASPSHSNGISSGAICSPYTATRSTTDEALLPALPNTERASAIASFRARQVSSLKSEMSPPYGNGASMVFK
jgi:hypothetical protein